MENDQRGDQEDNLRRQVQHFDELLEEQQIALRELLASPIGTNDEDDDLANELEDLARSEELLRQELTKPPSKSTNVIDPNNHESVAPINLHPQTSQTPKSNPIMQTHDRQKNLEASRRRSDLIPSHEEHGIVFYRDNWDDELFREHRENNSIASDAFELTVAKNFSFRHIEDGYGDIEEMGWNARNFVPVPVKDSPDKSKAELDMMLAADQPAASAIEEEVGQMQIDNRQRIFQTGSCLDNAALFSASAATVQPNMDPTVTPQKETQELSTGFTAKTPSPTKTYSMSTTPQSTDAPTPTRAPSPLKNTIAKLWFGKPSRPREENSSTPALLAVKMPWFARTPPPVAVKTGESIALAQAKTPPSKLSSSFKLSKREEPGHSVDERISSGSESAGVSTPTLVSILQNTMAFNPLERHHEQVLGSLMLSPESIVFESSSDDDTYDKSLEHARKNLDSALEGELPIEGSSSLVLGGFQNGPLFPGYPDHHVRNPSLGVREPPQRWSPASSSAGSKVASPDRCNTDDPETDYVRVTPEELYPEFDFYAPKSESLGVAFSASIKETQPENVSRSSPLHSSSDSASYESADQAPTVSVSFGTSSGIDVLRSNEARSTASVEEHLTKGSSIASQSFVTAIDDLPFAGCASVKTISSGDASHITYATAREQEEENSLLAIGQIDSAGDMDYELNNVEDGVALVESAAAPSKQLETYRNSDSYSETSQSQAYAEHDSSCLQLVKKISVSPLPVLIALLVIIAAVGLSIRLIIESTTNEDSAMMVPGGNRSAPSFSPSRGQLSPMPAVRTEKPTTPQNALNIPTLSPSTRPFLRNPTLAPLSDPTATPASALVPNGSPTINPSIPPTVQLIAPSVIRPATTTPSQKSLSPTRLPISAAPSEVLTDLMKFLSSVSFDTGTALRNTSTPQYAAYMWLSGNALLPSYSNDRLIQRYALATFYFSTDGDGWSQKSGWLSDGHECGWYMRSSIGPCDLLGFIVTFDLDYNDIGGIIPPELGLLSHLKLLDLGGGPNRQLSGSLPKEIGHMKMLQRILFRANRLTGTIPTEIGTLLNASELRLKGNYLRGTIPTEIGNMRNARIVDLSDNMLTGDIPTGVGNLIGLKSLFLDNNTLEGALPSEIGKLVALQTLSLTGNHITGIPIQIVSMVELTTLRLDRNEISGSIPSSIHELSNLRYLTLSENKFNSTIPSTLGNLMNLNELDLSLNQFTGNIPGEIGEINSRLRVVKMNGNQLTGSVPEKFSHLDRINTLALHDNLLVGAVPYTVCRVFEWIIPSFSIDCEEVDCPCCNFCCYEENGCKCIYKGTDEEWRCY